MLKCFQYNKGVYIKLGQFLSSLHSIIPKEITSKIKVLQDEAPVHTFEETKEIFKSEFHIDLNEV